MKEYPKNIKFGRVFRVKLKNYNISKNYLKINFFRYGLKAKENGKLQLKHLTAITRYIKKNFKKELFLKVNISLLTPVTKKPIETRMGKGKGERDHWECNIKKGFILFEFGGELNNSILKKSFKEIDTKLPMKTKIVKLIY